MIPKKATWKEIYERLKRITDKYPNATFYGIPRGGQVVAGLTGRATTDIVKANVIVDDIYDSGATAAKYEKYGVPMEF